MLLVVLVVTLNLALAGACAYGIWRLGRWRQQLAEARATLEHATRRAQRGLAIAPLLLLQGQLGLVMARQQYLLPWAMRWQQTRRAIALVSFALSFWRRTQRQRRAS